MGDERRRRVLEHGKSKRAKKMETGKEIEKEEGKLKRGKSKVEMGR